MWNWAERLGRIAVEGRQAVLVTVVGVNGSTPCAPGAKMLVFANGEFEGTVGGGRLEQLAIEDARKLMLSGSCERRKIPLGAAVGQCCGGSVELFFEPLQTGPNLYVFGAGHVGQAICRTLHQTPFRIHLIDERPEWLGSRQIPEGVTRHAEDWRTFVSSAQWDEKNTYVAVLTHSHELDQAIIEALIQKPMRYLGLIGSTAKWERFKQRMRAKEIDESLFSRVRCPFGLRIGGKAPAEVAISLAGELLKIYYDEFKSSSGSSD